MYNFFSDILMWFNQWFDPHYYQSIACSFFIIGLIGTKPILLSNLTQDYSFLDIVLIWIRRINIHIILILLVLVPLIILSIALYIYGKESNIAYKYYDLFIAGLTNNWEVILLGILFGKISTLIYSRIIKVNVSAVLRKFTARQSGESLSDIRSEKGLIKTKNFSPEKHYKDGYIFFGLNKENKPIYEKVLDFKTRNINLIGPTQTGKGVEIGVFLDQSIKMGHTVFFVDPKPDKHCKAIMKQACEDSNRKFIELDLNPNGRGKYNPFLGSTKSNRRIRLIQALGLIDTGTDGDFFKSGERSVIDKVFNDWDGRLQSLKQLLKLPENYEMTKRSVNYINEWLNISTFNPPQNRKGFSVEDSINNNSVVYIKGNLNDSVINAATTCLLIELTQEVIRINSDDKPHCFIAVDEIAFLISEKIADSLATIAGFNAHMLLAYQSESDLLQLKDKTQNGKAISQRVKVNCKTNLYYMAKDFETAKVMSDESGTVTKKVTRSQKVNIGKQGEETWNNDRDIHEVEENLVHTNLAKMLPDRVGLLYRPNQLAELLFTAWVDVDLEKYKDDLQKHETKPKAAVTVKKDKAPTTINNTENTTELNLKPLEIDRNQNKEPENIKKEVNISDI